MKYKFKRIDQLPQHIQGNCYVITADGHTMLPDDVAKRLNDLERALFNAPEKASSNNKYTAPQATPKSCPDCWGSGCLQQFVQPCPTCHGTGRA